MNINKLKFLIIIFAIAQFQNSHSADITYVQPLKVSKFQNNLKKIKSFLPKMKIPSKETLKTIALCITIFKLLTIRNSSSYSSCDCDCDRGWNLNASVL